VLYDSLSNGNLSNDNLSNRQFIELTVNRTTIYRNPSWFYYRKIFLRRGLHFAFCSCSQVPFKCFQVQRMVTNSSYNGYTKSSLKKRNKTYNL